MYYDIFISYRRKDSQGHSNVGNARALYFKFEKLGFNVFFDYNECTDNVFSDEILPAIRTCTYFLLVLTKDSLDRCKNEEDWLRREIEEAQTFGKKIIPITFSDNRFEGWPKDLPESLTPLAHRGGLQVTTIHNDASFNSDIDLLIKKRMGKPTSGQSPPGSGAVVHVETDYDCRVIHFKKELMIARTEEDNVLYLKKGTHKLEFVADGYPWARYECKQEIEDEEKIYTIDIQLKDRVNKEEKRLQYKEREEDGKKENQFSYENLYKELTDKIRLQQEDIRILRESIENISRRSIEERIDQYTDYSDAYHALAENYLNEKKYEKAWRAMEIALGIKENRDLLELRSRVFLGMNMYKDAKKDVERSIELVKKTCAEENIESLVALRNEITRRQNEERVNDKPIEIKIGRENIKMIKIEKGVFSMGSTDGDKDAFDDEKPVHRVLLNPYYLGETVVTLSLWREVMGNRSHLRGSEMPVENVSWKDANRFIIQLNNTSGINRPKGWEFSLPTEAQWEFAAKGGNLSKSYKYSGSDNIDEVAWYWRNSGTQYLQGTDDDWNCELIDANNGQVHSVRGLKPNELGLYDMSGNVWEWCWDRYEKYTNHPQIDPKGPNNGGDCVCRGGCWDGSSWFCRVVGRYRADIGYGHKRLGFRLALVPKSTAER